MVISCEEDKSECLSNTCNSKKEINLYCIYAYYSNLQIPSIISSDILSFNEYFNIL